MATAKRHAFSVPGRVGLAGELWSAALHDGRPAVVLGAGPGQPDSLGVMPAVALRLARAGFAVATFAFAGDLADEAARLADLEAVCAALARGDLVAQLKGPTRQVVFGYDGAARVARRYAAQQRTVALVTWEVIDTGRGGTVVSAEMITSGSHVVERSTQLGEALEGLLAWLARVM